MTKPGTAAARERSLWGSRSQRPSTVLLAYARMPASMPGAAAGAIATGADDARALAFCATASFQTTPRRRNIPAAKPPDVPTTHSPHDRHFFASLGMSV